MQFFALQKEQMVVMASNESNVYQVRKLRRLRRFGGAYKQIE